MRSGNFTSFTAILIVFIVQTLYCWPAKYAASHMWNGASRLKPQEEPNADVRTQKLLAVGARHDKHATEYSAKQTPLKSEVPLSHEILSIYRASAFHGEHYRRVDSDLSLRRTKRELKKSALHSSDQMETYPEPRPGWHVAVKKWSWAWFLHIYLFAALFWFVALVSAAFTVVNTLFAGARKGNAALKLSLHVSILLFSFSRALTLSIDPYASQGIMGSMVVYILWSAGFPIIITSFGLLLLVLLDTTKLSLAPPRYQNSPLAIGIMGINFVVVMVTDLTVLLTAGSHAILIICHVYLLTVGLIYTAGFMWVGHKISKRVAIHVPDNKLRRLRFLINVSVVISLLLIGVQIYAAVAVFGIYSEVLEVIDPWPWYVVQTCLRSSEIGMCIVISMLFSSSTNQSHNAASRFPRITNVQISPTPTDDVTVSKTKGVDTKL